MRAGCEWFPCEVSRLLVATTERVRDLHARTCKASGRTEPVAVAAMSFLLSPRKKKAYSLDRLRVVYTGEPLS
jgi:hypothetical protein